MRKEFRMPKIPFLFEQAYYPPPAPPGESGGENCGWLREEMKTPETLSGFDLINRSIPLVQSRGNKKVSVSERRVYVADAEALGFAVSPDEAMDLVKIGMKITKTANEQLGFFHPDNPDWSHISFCQIARPLVEENGVYVGRNAVAIQPVKLDRCPMGTGCSARIAVLAKKGIMKTGDAYIGESIIGSRFHCRLESETRVGELDAVIPSVSGRA